MVTLTNLTPMPTLAISNFQNLTKKFWIFAPLECTHNKVSRPTLWSSRNFQMHSWNDNSKLNLLHMGRSHFFKNHSNKLNFQNPSICRLTSTNLANPPKIFSKFKMGCIHTCMLSYFYLEKFLLTLILVIRV